MTLQTATLDSAVTEPLAFTKPVRLRIAFVVDRFGNRFGGAEAYGVSLMRELAVHHDVVVLAREYDQACTLRLPFIPLRSWKGLPSWIRVAWFAWRAARLTRQGYDIVHSHMNGYCGNIEVVHVTPVRYNWRVKPIAWHKRALSYISPRVQTYLALELRRVKARPGHRAVAVSGLIADQLQQAYGDQNEFPIILPGVASAGPAHKEERQRLRESFSWTDSDCVVLLVARNPWRKGLPTVLAALGNLPGDYKLLIVGGNEQSRRRLLDDPVYPGIVDRVQLVAETSDVEPYYRCADIYVHPTLNDSFAMAPLEAMSFGLPVVISPSPWCGFAEYLEHEHDAIVLSHPENVTELAQSVRRINEDDGFREHIVKGGNAVAARHAWSQVAQRYQDLYTQVMAEMELGRG
jgi:glycosyltransferase involved in cell wall biosynthesis